MSTGRFKQGVARWRLAPLLALVALRATTPAPAKSPAGKPGSGHEHRYIVLLEDPPLARYMADQHRAEVAQSARPPQPDAPAWKLNAHSAASNAYLAHLDQKFADFQSEAAATLGRNLVPVFRYRVALNGFAAQLSEGEAKRLAKLPGVVSVERDRVYKLHTDAGPIWIGADHIWDGDGFITESRGEGVVIGLIDSGINWDHPSFSDPGEGQPIPGGNHDFVNPYGEQLGLCSDPEVMCNDKLVGVYDFVEDDPNTDEVEENTKGKDDTDHGTHVASIATGNPENVSLGGAPLAVSGVAPNANLVSYRACYKGDSGNPCQSSAIAAAIDQAVSDGVDVINFSIGTDAFSPWALGSDASAFLNAVAAGIFVATSAGNAGPAASSIGSPANAPWIVAAGAATHNRMLASILKATEGGDTTPPGDLYGASLTQGGASLRSIVYAGDYGNALCGTGDPELQPDCDGNTGASNPFAPNTFHGEIVVCDRGTYGRVEKGKNVMLAGAGGYVLANTAEQGESIVADQHCLPGTHIGVHDGDLLRAWLASGTGQKASITGFTVVYRDSVADQVADFSSRGPNLPPAEGILKPDLIAPGVSILGADGSSTSFIFLSGTSMASPHIAGAAALLKSLRPSLSPSALASLLELTATTALAKDENGNPADRFLVGAGRPQLGEAALSGLYLDETAQRFRDADPQQGGDPRTLNLATMTDADCRDTCSFTRTVKPLLGGRTWTASTSGFPDGVEVTVSPNQFILNTGTSQAITVSLDLTAADVIGQWVEGDVHLTANNLPEAVMPVTVFASGGDLPYEWDINSNRDSGWKNFSLNHLTALPGATFRAGGLVKPQSSTVGLVEDPTWDDPYDGGQGVFTVLHQVPAGALWLHAETLASAAEDLDLYVGLDSNHDGQAQESEQVCSSTTPTDLELCDVFNPTAGTWWVLVQNWEDGYGDSDPKNGVTSQDVTVVSAVVGGGSSPTLSATGPGIVPQGEQFQVRVAWNDVTAAPDTVLLGAVGIGTDQDKPNNVGVVPVYFTRTGTAAPRTLALMDGRQYGIALDAGDSYDKMFIDVPPGTASLKVTAKGGSLAQNDGLQIELHRMDFAGAFANAPFVVNLPGNNPVVASASGSGGQAPTVTVTGATLQPGRWYPVVTNQGSKLAAVKVTAELESDGSQIALHPGLWQPASRPDISQGFEYSQSGATRAMLWYTYDEDNNPTWYLSAGSAPNGNVWTMPMLRFTNDGANQQSTEVGNVSMTLIGQDDLVFSWNLFGESGSDRMFPTLPLTCPKVSGAKKSYTGIWYRGVDGLGGASVGVDANNQTQVHYLYDAWGVPRWLLAAAGSDKTEFGILQFTGFCPTCGDTGTSYDTVGVLSRDFTSETAGSWNLNYMFAAPLEGDVDRTDNIVKITDTIACE